MASKAARRSFSRVSAHKAGARALLLGLVALAGQHFARSFVAPSGLVAASPELRDFLLGARDPLGAAQEGVERASQEGVERSSQRASHLGVTSPVKTVSEAIADFYRAYPQPPLLPLFRPFIVDFLTTTHLSVVDSRFAYDAVFALGVREVFDRIMQPYDAFSLPGESEKIWAAFVRALGFQPEQVAADAEAAKSYAKTTPSSQVLAEIEGGTASGLMGAAFSHIEKDLYSLPYGIGLFKLMEVSGAKIEKSNVEAWARALKVSPSRTARDLENFRANMNKLGKAQEMLRDNEIREKKELARKLEEKAKALAAKAEAAAGKAAPAPAKVVMA